jgi:hypothetical protein
LSAETASRNLNEGIAKRSIKTGKNGMVSLLVNVAESLTVHAVNGTIYERVWQREITERLLALKAQYGWDVCAPDKTLGGGFDDGKRPLYLSDHDLLAFVASPNHAIAEPGNPDGLLRGVIVENSTVGASKLRLTRFLFRGMCGNHIIWNASGVQEIAVRHVGNVRDSLSLWDAELKSYLDSSATLEESKIASAQRRLIADTRENVLDVLFGLKIPNLTRKALASGIDSVVPAQDGDSRSVWGIVQGLTRYSQTIPYGDTRTALDSAAGKLMDAF